MEFAIHKVLPENAYDYTACHIACWRSAYRGILPQDYLENMAAEIQPRTDRLLKNLAEQTEFYHYYYAALGERMIGRLIIGKSRDEDKSGAGEIGAIYLLEEYWGKGYGRRLMAYAIDALVRMGYREMMLWVLEENQRARRFYEKAGFVFDGTKKEIEIGRTLTELRYVLAL